MSTHRLHAPFITVLAPVLLMILSSTGQGATMHVPADKASISKALQASVVLDTIMVSPGIYYDLLNYLGKAVVVKSEAGPGVTELRPADEFVPLVNFASKEQRGAVLDGFTITGYNIEATPNAAPALNFTNRASPTIKNCVFRDNRGVSMALIADDGPVFVRCLFYHNTGAPVIAVLGGVVNLLNCTIDRCEYGVLIQSLDCEIRNTLITNCTTYGILGKVSQLDFNNVWNNGVNYDEGSVPGLHDISTDPLYMDDSNHDYRLQPNSPCINAGDPNPYLDDPDSTRGDIGYWYFQMPTDVGNDPNLPVGFSLNQNYPNPFNPNTHISFVLPHRAQVRLDVLNVLGAVVRSLVDAPLPAGQHTVDWDGQTDQGVRTASGVYFYRLAADDFVSSRKMVLLK